MNRSFQGAVSIGATIAYMDKACKLPAVLIIMGTGTTDRDGNLKNFKTDLYKNLSDFFVENGFVCARYDKRGTHKTTGNYNTAGVMMNAKWVSEHGSYTSEEFVRMLEEFEKPTLAITGTADLSADYKMLHVFENMEHVQTYAPKDVNHMLRVIDDDNSMMTVQKQYKRLATQPVHKETEEVITRWLQQFI